jgi:hypothetical protein
MNGDPNSIIDALVTNATRTALSRGNVNSGTVNGGNSLIRMGTQNGARPTRGGL